MLGRSLLFKKSLRTPLLARTMASKSFVKYNWQDPLNLESLLTEDEVSIRDAAKSYCQAKLLPRVIDAYRNERKIFLFISILYERCKKYSSIPFYFQVLIETF